MKRAYQSALAERRLSAQPRLPQLPRVLPANIERLTSRCPVSGRLLAMARLGEPLGQEEVHVLVQLFAQLDEEGRRFIHQMLAASPGYDPDAVNRAIGAVSPQPIGCQKIRRLLRESGAPDLCGCVFRLPENGYATPLVHLDMFPRAAGKVKQPRTPPPNLDEDGRQFGYLSRFAKAATRLLRLAAGAASTAEPREAGGRKRRE